MNILLINCQLEPLPGHRVQKLFFTKGGTTSLGKRLQNELPDFQPELIVQQELLGVRVFFQDLWQFKCCKIFWAIDSHLNLYWQKHYATCFDLVLSPHLTLWQEAKNQDKDLPKLDRLIVPGYDQPYRPHAQRSQFGLFVGRIDQNRAQRARFSEFLTTRHQIPRQQLNFAEMLAAYNNTRVLPNESIGREYNFRITEGASCGCCVLSEDIGEDLASNFKIGQEVLTYRHALELDEQLTYLRKNQDLAKKIGQAAWVRVQKEHLPRHSWQRILDLAQKSSIKNLSQEDNYTACLLAAAYAMRGNNDPKNLRETFLGNFKNAPATSKVLASQLRLLAETGRREDLHKLVAQIIENSCAKPVEAELNVAIQGAALFLEDQDLLLKHQNLKNNQVKQINFLDQAIFLARQQTEQKKYCHQGFNFDPQMTCPETAYDFLLLATRYAKSSEDTRRLHAELFKLSQKINQPEFCLIAAADYSLEHQNDWKASLAYAISSLRSFHVKDGQEELALAASLAKAQGALESFSLALSQYGLKLNLDQKT
ncbi:MAG: glycosyltransferase family 1 protein [Desulfovibrio sp.]|nr:glycosyltransferase family 1 protein [Desulfovibrio sp.]